MDEWVESLSNHVLLNVWRGRGQGSSCQWLVRSRGLWWLWYRGSSIIGLLHGGWVGVSGLLVELDSGLSSTTARCSGSSSATWHWASSSTATASARVHASS